MFREIVLTVFAAFITVGSAVLPVSSVGAIETGGSGGTFSDQTNVSFTATNGQTSRYHVFAAGLPQDEPLGIVLQFHGDGAYEFNNPDSAYSLGGSTGIIAKSRERNMITVPVLSPDTQGSITWWEDGEDNARFADDLLNYLKSLYNIDTERIWLVGYSGGSQFITQFYVPLYSSSIDGGGAVIFGGGGKPYSITPQPFAADFVADFPMHWYTGNDDDGRGGTYNALNHTTHGAKAGKAWYDAQGFTTSNEWPLGVGHALGGQFGKTTRQQLALHDTEFTGTIAPLVPTLISHTVTPTTTGATLNATATDVGRITFRVSASPFGTQTGWYLYGYPDNYENNTVNFTMSDNLSPNTFYYYQVEEGVERNVLASGTFITSEQQSDPTLESYTVTGSRRSVRLNAHVSGAVSNVTFRLSTSPFGTQQGLSASTKPDKFGNVSLNLRNGVSGKTTYYYAIELNGVRVQTGDPGTGTVTTN